MTATRTADLIERLTDARPVFPVAVLRTNGNGPHLYLYSSLDLVAVCGPCDPSPRDRVRVVRADLRGCRDVGEALAVVGAAVRPLVLL